jgi:hypothetical protein
VVAPDPIPEHDALARRRHALVATVMGASANGEEAGMALAEELLRVVQVVEGALLLGESDLIEEQVDWLHHTGAAHGFSPAQVEAALLALADAMDGDLLRAGTALRGALS